MLSKKSPYKKNFKKNSGSFNDLKLSPFFFNKIFHLDIHYVCMLVQRFEPQGRRFTNFHYYYYKNKKKKRKKGREKKKKKRRREDHVCSACSRHTRCLACEGKFL